MTDAMTDKRSEPDEAPKASSKKADYVAKQRFDAELHDKEVTFEAGDEIPGNVAQKTLDRWIERDLIKKA